MIYIASRASIPERSALWRHYRDVCGSPIISSWIDEAGEGETGDFGKLWMRIWSEVRRCTRFVLYVEGGDFPLKGALIETGMALAFGKPVWVLGRNVKLEGRTCKPLGSWIKHPLVMHLDLDVSPIVMADALMSTVGKGASHADK